MLIDALPDEQIRNSALDTRRSFHLEAPAGSGKTWLLTGRFLKLLAEVDHPHEILALTFTNKAAGEMRQRIRELLDRASSGDAPRLPGEAHLLEAAARANQRQPAHRLAAPDGLRIMTFHGFCLHLVHRAPLEASIPPGSNIMADEEQEHLRSQVVSSTLSGLLQRSRNDPLRQAVENRLLRVNNNWPSLSDELVELLGRRDLLWDLLEVLGHYPDKRELGIILAERLELLIKLRLEHCRSGFEASSLGENWTSFVAHLRKQGAAAGKRLPESLPPAEGSELADWQKIATTLTTASGSPRKQLGPAAGFYSGFSKTEWAEAIQTLSTEALDHLQSVKALPSSSESTSNLEDLYDLVLIVGRTLNRYQSLCRQRHLLDYVDLEQSALRLFDQEAPTDLQLFLDRKIQHLLVDEFQDTSHSQWLLMQNLCSGWIPGDRRTLFLVGDPKQSIYAFRRAEVSLFLKAKNGLPLSGQGYLPLECLQLESNFRSHPRLVGWCSQLFGQTIMAHVDPEADEVSYVPATAMTEPVPEQLSLALFTGENRDQDPRAAEARWLATMVLKELECLSAEERIGILLFARTHLTQYLKCLEDAGVAVQVQEGRLLLEQGEVLHLRQIAHALVRPQDDLAWAALLRSPWSWLPLEQFIQIAEQPEESWLEKTKAVRDEFPEVNRLWDSMARARRRLGRDELAVLVEAVWMELDGPASVARKNATAGVANCRSFLGLLSQAEQGIPEETLENAERLLRTAYTPTDPTAAPSPVELMTVHRAKGLEFDVVFLPFMDWHPLSGGRGSQPPYLLERLPVAGGDHLIAIAPDRRRETAGGVYSLLRQIREKKRLAEAKRLFYVAATRARRSLYLSGVSKVAKGQPSPRRQSPLWWLCKHHRLQLGSNDQLLAERKDDLELYLNPVLDTDLGAKRIEAHRLPEPLVFTPEPLPYTIVTPSELAEKSKPIEQEREGLPGRVRGVVTHGILERLGRGYPLPGLGAVAAALLHEEIPETDTKILAKEILQEIQTCLEEPFFIWLLGDDHSEAYSELTLEDQPSEHQIRTGTIDRLVFDGSLWWVVDYKTSRPVAGESEDLFLERETDSYRQQLLAYQDMVENAFKVKRDVVRPVLYFTALQQRVELSA